MNEKENRALEERISELERELAEQKRAAEMLYREKEKFNRFLDQLPQPVYEINAEGWLTYANRKAFDLYEYTFEDFERGINAFDLVVPEDRPRVIENTRLRAEGNIVGGTEYTTVKKNGEHVPVLIYSVPIITEKGTPVIRGLIIDITDRKKAEEALRESEERYREIFDLIPISIWEYDFSETLRILDGLQDLRVEDIENYFEQNPNIFHKLVTSIRLIDVNNETVAMYGARTKEEIFSEYGKHQLPETLKVYLDVASAYLAGKRYIKTETVNETLDGRRINVVLQVTFTKEMKESGRALVTALNVTEQKKAERALRESERKFRSIVEQSTDGITVVDEEGFVIEWNRGNEQITGIKRAKAVGATLWDLTGTPTCLLNTLGTPEKQKTPDNRVYFYPARASTCGDPYEKTLKDILRTGDIPPDMKFMEVTLCRADGDRGVPNQLGRPAGAPLQHVGVPYRVIQQVVSPVKTDRGYMLIITTRDVTELKQMEEERLKTGKLESVGLLAGGIAHDFNNILVSILGNISLAKSSLDAANPVSELLVKAEKAGERARDLTHQLLTFSKGGTPVKETLSVEEIIRESAEFSLRGSNVRCEFSFPHNLSPVEVDRSQIIQVMNNLILNADQAMPEGGVIRIRAENVKVTCADGLPLPEREYIRVTVCDQGVGISPENLPKIFDPYFTTKAEGSGLGLTTTYSIVRNHDGYIYTESEEGVGTVFTIFLPTAGEHPNSGQSDVASVPDTHGRILVMDDEKGVREVAAEMLIHLGHEVEVVPDGIEAVRRYREACESGRPFNAVIMDLTIPGGMGGKATVQELLAFDPRCRVIVSSGYSRDSILSDYVKYGFTGVIAKPYRIEELREVVNRVLAGA